MFLSRLFQLDRLPALSKTPIIALTLGLSGFSLSAETQTSVLGDEAVVESSEPERVHSVPELSTTILIGVGGILLIFRKRRIG